jgi:hypothetical protein
MLDNRFYIFDCCGRMAGNPKGYQTMRAALSQANRRKSKLYANLKARFEAWPNRNPNESLRYLIKQVD